MVDQSVKPLYVLLAGLTPEVHISLREIAFSLPDIERLERVPSLTEAIEISEDCMPDVLLMEMSTSEDNHSDLLRRMVRRDPHPAIIAVAEKVDAELLLQAIFLGAVAFIPLDTPLEFIISTIRHASQGEEPIKYNVVGNLALASQVVRTLRGSNLYPGLHTLPSPLSEQQQVLLAIARGLSNKEISIIQGLKEQTVKNYISTIFKRIGARDRVHAVVIALRSGWVKLDQF